MRTTMIFFDLDNTLLDEDSARKASLPEFFKTYRHLSSYDFSTFSQNWIGSLEIYYRMFLDGELTIEEQRLRRIEYSFGIAGLPRKELEEMGRAYTLLNESSWMVFPEWKPFLEKSSSKKAIVTNGSAEQQRKKLRLLGLERHFDNVFISEEVGYAKPSKRLFEFLLASTGLQPQDCIFVGDSLENDILPSLEMGMKAIWLNHYGKASGITDRNLREVETVERAVNALEKLENREEQPNS